MSDQACAPRPPQPSDLVPSERQSGPVRLTEPWATKVPPTQETVRLHFAGLGETQEQADEFYCHYAGNGWRKGNVPVITWVMTVESWRKKRSKFDSQPLRSNNGGPEFSQRGCAVPTGGIRAARVRSPDWRNSGNMAATNSSTVRHQE